MRDCFKLGEPAKWQVSFNQLHQPEKRTIKKHKPDAHHFVNHAAFTLLALGKLITSRYNQRFGEDLILSEARLPQVQSTFTPPDPRYWCM